MDENKKEVVSYCRQCGGDRHHLLCAEKNRSWQSDDSPMCGGDTWSIVECRGCHTVTFLHSHWLSEDIDFDGASIIHKDLYPPAHQRKMPEWFLDFEFLHCFNLNDLWVPYLLKDIYEAIGMKSYALAAMGLRALLDFIVTSKAEDGNDFRAKLKKMHGGGLIGETQIETIYAAFDAGSAAAHRGYSPTLEDVSTLLDITESLLRQLYVAPAQQERQAKAANHLKSKTPQRPTATKGS